MADNKKMCRMPLRAKYKIIDDEPVMAKADWVDVDPDVVAKFIIDKLGVQAVKQGIERANGVAIE